MVPNVPIVHIVSGPTWKMGAPKESPPVKPTRVSTTPEAQPNWASGNQNQDIPKDALFVLLVISERMFGVNFVPEFNMAFVL